MCLSVVLSVVCPGTNWDKTGVCGLVLFVRPVPNPDKGWDGQYRDTPGTQKLDVRLVVKTCSTGHPLAF
jgi:hypothetical protein